PVLGADPRAARAFGLQRGAARGDAPPGRAARSGGRACRVAALVAALPGGAGCARGGPPARLEARDPLEFRPGPDRGVEGADRRAVRRDRRRRGDRLVQTRPPPLARAHPPDQRAATAPPPPRRLSPPPEPPSRTAPAPSVP